MHIVYLGLGANKGNKSSQILKAITLLKKKLTHVFVAPIYETKPWGFKDQENFLNTVISGKTEMSPIELFQYIKNVEKEIGRKKRYKNGPREIDIDLLFYDDIIYSDTNLTIPHPRISKRDFVLKPLCDLNPDLLHPILNKTVLQLFKEVKDHYVLEKKDNK